MGQIIPTFQAQPKVSMIVTLGDGRYSLTFTYRPRLNAWYLDISTVEGTALASGRRLSPGWDQLFGLVPAEGRPTGHLFVRGSDPYTREMLGDRVLPVYYTPDEITAPASSSGLSVALLP